MGKLTFILGGARSGKSHYAQQLASQRGQKVLFIATAQAFDAEMQQRIKIHQQERPQHWKTLEVPLNVSQALTNQFDPADIILLDCLTLLVSNILLATGAEENVDEQKVTDAVDREVNELLELVATHSTDWIIVSNEVGLGLVPPYPLGRVYRDVLGKANQRIVARADEVIFMMAGLPLLLKPLQGSSKS